MNNTIDVNSIKEDMKKELQQTIEEDMAQQLSRLNMLWNHQVDMSTYDKDHADYRLIPAIKAIKQHCRIETQKQATNDGGYSYSIKLVTDGIEVDDFIANLIELTWANTEKTAAYTV